MVTGGRRRYDLSHSRVGMRTWEKENDEYPPRRRPLHNLPYPALPPNRLIHFRQREVRGLVD